MGINLIDKIVPKNSAFRGMVDAEQLVGTAGSFGANIVGTATGFKGYRPIPYKMTLTGWRMTGNAAGSIVVDIKACAAGSLPSTVSICAAAKPTLSSARSNSDTTLTGWTTTLNAGDVVEFYVDSISGLSNVTLDVQYERAV